MIHTCVREWLYINKGDMFRNHSLKDIIMYGSSPVNGQKSNPFPPQSKANMFFSYSTPPHSK